LVDGQDRAPNALRGDSAQLIVPPDAKLAVDVEVERAVGVASKDRRIFGDRRELVVAVPDKVAQLRMQPETVGTEVEREDAAARQAVVLAGAEGREALPIESDEPVEGGEPEVPIGGLHEVVDGVDGQPVPGRPVGLDVAGRFS